MSSVDLHTQPYRRPLMWRGVEPQRMNWLWALICDLGGIEADELVRALHSQGVAVNARHARRWLVDSRADEFFPLSIVELERNVRALIALRESDASNLLPDVDTPFADIEEAAETGSDPEAVPNGDEALGADDTVAEAVVEETPMAGAEALREMADF